MTAKQKADELIEKVKKATTYEYQEYAGANYSTFEHDIEELKNVALIMVDEIIKTLYVIEASHEAVSARYYWIDVKKELEKDSIFLKS